MMFPDPSMSACPPTRIVMCETPAVARVLTAFNTSGDPMDSRCFAMSCSGFNFSSFARATGATERADASNSVKQNRPINDLDDIVMPPCERRQTMHRIGLFWQLLFRGTMIGYGLQTGLILFTARRSGDRHRAALARLGRRR